MLHYSGVFIKINYTMATCASIYRSLGNFVNKSIKHNYNVCVLYEIVSFSLKMSTFDMP